jgi:hypothetical protein
MKTILLISSLFFATWTDAPKSEKESEVYICVSTTAKRYHYSENCRGLKQCSHTIKKISLSEARNKYKRTLCGYED